MNTAEGKLKSRVAGLSVASNSALVALKLVTGWATGSISVVSEALHSGLDLVASGIAFFSVRQSAVPPDEAHRYGHGKFESLSGAAESGLVLVAAALVAWAAVRRLIHPGQGLERHWLGMAVMGFSMLINLVVASQLRRVARQTNSVALEADAWHLQSDVVTSGGVLVTLLLIWFGHRFAHLHLDLLDPVAAIVLAGVIVRMGWGIARSSLQQLTDRSAPEQEELVHRLIEQHYPQVLGAHRIRSRVSGPEIQLDLHLEVPPDMHVDQAHQLCDHLERDIHAAIPRAHVVLHVEPPSIRMKDE